MGSEIFADGLLAGRVAIVTGGGTGLGLAAATELARCGAAVVIAGRREDVLADAAMRIGGDVTTVAADVREPEGAERIVAAALDRHGRLDVLLNNAGGQYFVPAESLVTKGWRAVHRLNLSGTELMCRTAYERAFRPAGAGTIINVTVSPHNGMPGMAHTSAARAAVEAYTRAFADEWAPVNVIALASGPFGTDALSKYPDVVQASVAMSVPLQRVGDPIEQGWLVALCASPLGAALSGSTVTLDGGRDNWFGPWPPPALVQDGEVPTEARPGAPPPPVS
jgi:citronellol/citronellal dehydrogenase